jgi:hypothetical protein
MTMTWTNNLIWGAIANAKNPNFGSRPLWAVVRDIFGCGSSMATDLCREHGFDPDKEMPPIVCPTCERDLIYIWGTEDDMIVLNKEGGWHVSLYASCPKQAKDFFKTYENEKFSTTEEWEDTLIDFQLEWAEEQENYE